MLRTSMPSDVVVAEGILLVVAESQDHQIPEVVENRACRDDRDVDLQGVVQNARGIYLQNICHLPDLSEVVVVELVATNFVYPEANLLSILRMGTP